jgi:2'-5' RNA ligase
MASAETMRTFVAILPPKTWIEALAATQDALRRAIDSPAFRWVQPEQIHMTLRFFGTIPVADAAQIVADLDRISRGTRTFTLTASALGCFPTIHRARVLWLGIENEIPIRCLQQKVVEATRATGDRPDDRSFKAHLTLARIKELRPEAGRRLGEALAETRFAVNPWDVQEILLMRSHLSAARARYETVHRSALAE